MRRPPDAVGMSGCLGRAPDAPARLVHYAPLGFAGLPWALMDQLQIAGYLCLHGGSVYTCAAESFELLGNGVSEADPRRHLAAQHCGCVCTRSNSSNIVLYVVGTKLIPDMSAMRGNAHPEVPCSCWVLFFFFLVSIDTNPPCIHFTGIHLTSPHVNSPHTSLHLA